LLIATIHDVSPASLAACQRLRDALDHWGVDRVTLLAVPRFHHGVRLERDPGTVRWLRACVDAGDEVALHGDTHLERRRPRGVDGLRARLWSAGEAEFLSLARGEREAALRRGKVVLENALGEAVRGFVAPAWLEPRPLANELRRAGFCWHETSTAIRALGDRRRLCSPVVGFATRTRTRELMALAWARALAGPIELAGRLGVAPARVALHPADTSSPVTMAAAARVLRAFASRLRSMTTAAALARA
jgi:hypothetical protein